MDGLTDVKVEALTGNRYGLCTSTLDMHFDPTGGFVVNGLMAKAIDVEVGPEFGIHAMEQVEVEGGSHSFPIVVGRVKNCVFLLEIDADQAGSFRPDQTSQTCQKTGGGVRLEVANSRSRKERDPALPRYVGM